VPRPEADKPTPLQQAPPFHNGGRNAIRLAGNRRRTFAVHACTPALLGKPFAIISPTFSLTLSTRTGLLAEKKTMTLSQRLHSEPLERNIVFAVSRSSFSASPPHRHRRQCQSSHLCFCRRALCIGIDRTAAATASRGYHSLSDRLVVVVVVGVRLELERPFGRLLRPGLRA
jgi:hypothetical protein